MTVTGITKYPFDNDRCLLGNHPRCPRVPSPKQTIAYDILVGGLLVAILGGLVWKRGTGAAAAASVAVGAVITLGTMIILEINAAAPLDGIYANEPICYGLLASAIAYIAVALLTKPTDPR
ncbi:MAG: sodium:solute symporter [Arthrobacter sp.]|nr:sodium:solute symporter [Arthrobacter sp.]